MKHITLLKQLTITFFTVCVFIRTSQAQIMFSIATDFSVIQNFKKEQQFRAFGQTILSHFHFTPKDGAYIWISYYYPAEFKNNLSAEAKSLTTIPQQINFVSKSKMRIRNISTGYKHYFKGASNIETSWSLYGNAGFGLQFGYVENIYSTNIDTALYNTPLNPVNGNGNFKRLTLDLAAGWEIPIGSLLFLYVESKALIPTTEYPSKYLLVNNNAPLFFGINIGLRIFFDNDY